MFDSLTDKITIYSSISEAAQAIGCFSSNLFRGIKKKGVSTFINNRYRVLLKNS